MESLFRFDPRHRHIFLENLRSLLTALGGVPLTLVSVSLESLIQLIIRSSLAPVELKMNN